MKCAHCGRNEEPTDEMVEAARDVVAWFSKRAVPGWSESEDGLRINKLRAALAVQKKGEG